MRTAGGNMYLAGTTKPEQGVWYYVVGTYDGSGAKIYVNGVLEHSLTH